MISRRFASTSADLSHVLPFSSKEITAANINKIFSPTKSFFEAIPADRGYCIKALTTEYQDGFILRKELLDAISLVEKNLKKDKHFILTGKKGCGKSIVLMQLANYFHEKGWIVLYFPRVKNLFSGYEHFEPSSKFSGMYQQPGLTSKVLGWILKMNQNLQKVAIPKLEYTKAANMSELLREGADKESKSSLVFTDFLQLLTRVDRPPVLVAMDQVHGLYMPTGFHGPDSQLLMPDQMVIPNALLKLTKNLPNGVLFSSTDEQHSKRAPLFRQRVASSKFAIESNNQDFLQDSLKLDNSAESTIFPDEFNPADDPFQQKQHLLPNNLSQLRIGNFTKEQTAAILYHYKSKGLILDSIGPNFLQMMHTISNGNPQTLLEDCLEWISPEPSKSYLNVRNYQ